MIVTEKKSSVKDIIDKKKSSVKDIIDKKKGAVSKKKLGLAAAILTTLTGLGIIVRKIQKANPNSEVIKEAKTDLKKLQKAAKDAQTELKKASTPEELDEANKKIDAINKAMKKARRKIAKLADKNLEPDEVKKVTDQLQRMVAESVAPAYTEAEMMFIELTESTAMLMEEHYDMISESVEESETEVDSLDDIFSESLDDIDESIFDDELNDSKIFDNFLESFDDLDDFDWEY